MPAVTFYNTYSDMSDYRDGYDESYRRVTDELNRYKLSDVQEADEYEEDYSFRSFYSTYKNRFSSFGSTGSSMDALWDLHPSRLSEAGLSRYSDNSTILTEDTDSFIIGQRVWVGGTKPGQIAFIGETQFAPGEWAGIVLDQAIGKNDGSVAGHRYFQCEAKRGVFSRLTRLTRVPLPGADLMGSGDTFSVASSDAMRARKLGDLRRSPPTNGKSHSSLRSPTPLSASNTSLHSAVPELKLGDRVIVSSSQGSKIGTLRYIGFTAFANGEWCGVELDNPVGKNDGSVQGKRYFDCLPNYGVFAPMAKVSRSPSKTKPGNCVIHSTGIGASPSLRRVNSRESLASMTSSIVSSASGMRRVRLGVTSLTPTKKSLNTPPKSSSTPVATRLALQDVLKEKQKHIEQLLKERDFERDAITRAANQADNAEQKLAITSQEFVVQKQQFENYRAECEVKLQAHLLLLSKLKKDREDLLTQLDDEKRKNEDIQFRFEEAAITKTDVEATNDSYLVKIKDLESQVNSERKRYEEVESESFKDVSLLKEQLIESKEQVESLKSELESIMTKNSLLTSAEISTSGHLEELKTHLYESKSLFEKTQIEYNKVIDDLNNKLSRSSSELELTKFTLNKEIEDLQIKMTGDNTTKTEAMNTLTTEVETSSKMLEDKVKEFEVLKHDFSTTENYLNREIEKFKIELSSKVFDIETGNDLVVKYKVDLESLQGECDRLKSELEVGRNSNDKDLDLIRNQQVSVSVELGKANQLVAEKTLEIDGYKNRLSCFEETNRVLENAKQVLEQKIQENVDTTKNLEETIADLQKNSQLSIEKLSTEIAIHKSNIDERDSKFDLISKDIETLKVRCEEVTSELAKSKEIINTNKLEIGDLERKLASEQNQVKMLSELKIKLENDLQGMLTSSGDNSSKFEEFMTEAKEKDSVIEKMQANFILQQQESQHAHQEMQLLMENNIKDTEKLKADYEEAIRKLLESEKKLQQKLNCLKNEALVNVQSLNKELTDLQSNLLASNNRLTEAKNHSSKTEEDLKKKLEEQNVNLTSEIASLKQQEAILQKNLEQANDSNVKLLEAANNDREKLINDFHIAAKNLEQAVVKNNDLIERVQELGEIIAVRDNELKQILEDQSVKELSLKNKEEQSDDLLKKYTEIENTLRTQLQKIQTESADTENNLNKIIEGLQNSLSEKIAQLEKLEADRNAQEAQIYQQLELFKSEKHSKIVEFNNKLDSLSLSIQQQCCIIEQQKQELDKVHSKNTTDNNNWVKKEEELNSELQKTVQESEVKLEESQNQLKLLQEELDSVKKDSNSNIIHSSVKDKEINTLTVKINELNQSLDRIRLEKEEIKHLAITEGRELEETHSKHLAELRSKIGELEGKVSKTESLQEDFEAQRNNYAQVVNLLQITEKQKQTLVKQLEETVNAKAQSVNCTDLINIVKKVQVNNTDVGKIMELQMLVDQAEKDKEDFKRSLKIRDADIEEFKTKLSQALAENTKKSKIPIPLDDNAKTVYKSNGNPNYQQLLEEKLFVESQVQFLNTIIVDMKKKTEEQQARIDILESGYGADVADEIALMGAVDRRVAPRKYCDICEEFDLHETEDCPIQDATSMMPPAGLKKKPEPRPYCEICEVFGHETEHCPEDETY